ncbi:MAG: DUF2989 domain-containing protein [Psychromonas sp.]|nr:DUF2989 domain-containing protein [Psychromonas sp.]
MKKWLMLLIALLLVGCYFFQTISLKSICKGYPELCDDLYKVSDCRFARVDVIRARYFNKIEPTGIHQHDLLTQLDKYHTCLQSTLLFQLTGNIKRKKRRLHNYFTTKQLIKNVIEKSKGTDDPFLAYYLWIHFQDQQAKSVFIKAAMDKNMKNADLISKLAVTYYKSNPDKSLKYFFRALRVSHSIDDLPSNLFINIMSIYYRKSEFKNAYLWALVYQYAYKKNNLAIDLDMILQRGMSNGKNKIKNKDALKKLAKQFYDQLRGGVFNQYP